MGTAGVQGDLWGSRARDWANYQEPTQVAYYDAVHDALGVGNDTVLLDAACGAGLATQLAAKRGAKVTGFDASEALLDIARERVPGNEFRQGELEELPFAENSFNTITSFNGVQYAADPEHALSEVKRVAANGAHIAVVTWGAPERCQAKDILAAIGSLLPPPPPGAPGPFALSAPGLLEGFVESVGLEAVSAEEVPTPFVYADLDSAVRGMRASGPAERAAREAGEDRTNDALRTAFVQYAQADGTVVLDNVFRYVIALKK